ncbi:hypothetical protein L7F22_024372 [Adiantum nelumboides]|nr:hypothetical protein [Adiantum nelumboides]
MSPPLGPSSHRQKLKVLCLHGLRTSGIIMETQLRKLDQTVLDLLDMTCLDAPHPANGKSDVEGIFQPPYLEWFQFKKTEAGTIFTHLRECIQFILDFMEKHGPWHCWIFSGSFYMKYNRAHFYQQHLQACNSSCASLLSYLVVCFMSSMNGRIATLNLSSAHLIGTRDFLLPRNEELLQKFDNSILIRHDARHTVPRLDASAVLPMKSFLKVC